MTQNISGGSSRGSSGSSNGTVAGGGSMTSSRPYLLRAVHDWIVDNGLTPQIVVDAETEGVQIPVEYVHEGRIVLNISAHAVRNLNLGNDWVTFGARFGGRPFEVFVPTSAVLAVMARETGAGMSFPEEAVAPAVADSAGLPATDSKEERPQLRPIEGTTAQTLEAPELDGASGADSMDSDREQDPPPDGTKGPPRLRVIK